MNVDQPSSGRPELRRVTVINDSPEFLELMGDFLEGERFAASLIDGDGISSLEPIRAADPELLIVDLRLQGAEISGWDILQAARADRWAGCRSSSAAPTHWSCASGPRRWLRCPAWRS